MEHAMLTVWVLVMALCTPGADGGCNEQRIMAFYRHRDCERLAYRVLDKLAYTGTRGTVACVDEPYPGEQRST